MKKKKNSSPKGKKDAQVVDMSPSSVTSNDGTLDQSAKKRLQVVLVVLVILACTGAALNALWHLLWPFTTQ